MKPLYAKEGYLFSLKEKGEKLTAFAESVLDNPLYKPELAQLMGIFFFFFYDVLQAFLEYDLDIFAHGNEIYDTHLIRIVLYIHNLVAGSWHIERQETACSFINTAKPKKAIDLGFGVPSQYIKEVVMRKNFHLTLCDKSESAILFAQELLKIWDPNWPQTISFLKADMMDITPCSKDYDLYIALHSLEHVPDPAYCLSRYVETSAPSALFLLELPIGPITPEHYIAWHSINEVKEWIKKRGIRIMQNYQIYVNPKVDLFAEQHHFNYSGYLMLGKKGRTLPWNYFNP